MRYAVASLAALAVVAACGGEDRLSKEQFIAKADAICAKYEKRLDAIPEPDSPQEVPAFVDKGVPLARREVAEIRELKPPEEDEATVDRMLDQVERTIRLLEKLGEQAEQGDASGAQATAAEIEASGDKADELARDYGLKECGSED